MLLPIIVIILVSIGIYLAFQKNMSNQNKIIIAILAVVCFNLAYMYLKKTTVIGGNNNEGFVAVGADDYMDGDGAPSDDGAFDIEEASPDYDNTYEDDANYYEEPNQKKENTKENYNNMNGKPQSIQSAISSINYKDRTKSIINAATTATLKPTNTPVPTLGSLMRESFADGGNPQSSIGQSGVQGTGNIFNPQIIIKSGGGGGGNGNVISSSMSEITSSVYSSAPHWQAPSTDIWADGNAENQPMHSTTPYPTNNSSMDMIQNKINNDYNNAYVNRRTCGQYNPPPDAEGTDYPYAKKTEDMSRKYFPGDSFAPPDSWDIPQKRPPVCLPEKGYFNPAGVFDRGTPTNVLELTTNGDMCMTESECALTNVGSIMPKFHYEEFRQY
jgi:hypothetical protein